MAESDQRLPETLKRVLEDFQDPKFLAEVEVFVNTNIPLFATVSTDGSHPIEWQLQHKKYKKMYEARLLRTLELSDAGAEEFMSYLEQCNEHYANDPGFRQLMASLTVSEDYEAFLQVMFAAVRENWEAEQPERPPEAEAAPSMQVHEVDVTIPEGVGPGMAISIEYLGLAHQVAVPEGFGPGMAMRVQLQVPAA
mmetsp:Transcript_4489/g.10437  ORF Transcript_4489/g.10437 Transcript_4489/m.10437 type:complete len:195 (-) Transcript_4489:94-678(-)